MLDSGEQTGVRQGWGISVSSSGEFLASVVGASGSDEYRCCDQGTGPARAPTTATVTAIPATGVVTGADRTRRLVP